MFTEMEFVKAVLKQVISLYNSNNASTPVVLVGHSMGGVLARALVGDTNEAASAAIRVLVTMCSPWRAPGTSIINCSSSYTRTYEYTRKVSSS